MKTCTMGKDIMPTTIQNRTWDFKMSYPFEIKRWLIMNNKPQDRNKSIIVLVHKKGEKI
jgi:hypothetical protein